jgi:hypothetical protein
MNNYYNIHLLWETVSFKEFNSLGGEEYITYAWEGKNLGLNNSYINLFKNWKYIP